MRPSLVKIFGKNLIEYWKAAKKFLLLSFFLMAVISVSRLFFNYNSGLIDLLLAISILVWAGWTVVAEYKFTLKQTGVVGVLISFMTIWALFIFDPMKDIPKIIVVNTIVYGLVAIFGGLLAKIIRKKATSS